jgi:hypothetical protein
MMFWIQVLIDLLFFTAAVVVVVAQIAFDVILFVLEKRIVQALRALDDSER